MKYYGKIQDQKDLITKEYADAKVATTSSILKGDGAGHAVAAEVKEAEVVSIDSAPIQNSSNLVTSGGVYSAINAKENKGKITISGVEKTANTHTVSIVTDGVTTTMMLVGVS